MSAIAPKYVHVGFVVFYFVVVILLTLVDACERFTQISLGCLAGTGKINDCLSANAMILKDIGEIVT